MTGPDLAQRNALQLLAPDLRIRVGQRIVGLRANARQRRAQLVGHVARKLTLGSDALVKAHQHGVNSQPQTLNITRAGARGHRRWHRRQVAGVAPVNGTLQFGQWYQVVLNHPAQPPH